MNVRQNTTLGDGNMPQKLVQLLVVSDGKLEMTGNDTSLLVVTGSVTSQLKNFSSEILENSGEVDRSTGTNTLSIVALSQKTVDTTDREGETSLRRTTSKKKELVNVNKKAEVPCTQNWANTSACSMQLEQRANLRLSVLRARGFATRFSASHFE